MGLLEQKKVVRFGLESPKGTPVVTTLYIQAFEIPAMDPDPANTIERDPGGASLSPESAVVGSRFGSCAFETELKGNGATGLDATLAAMLQCAGWTLATLTYTPSATIAAQKTGTLDLYEDGRLKRLAGAMADVRFKFTPGMPIRLAWTWKGIWQAVTDVAIPAETISAQPVMLFGGASVFTLPAGTTPSVGALEFGLNCTLAPHEDATVDGGHSHYEITDRKPDISWDPEQALVAGNDYYGQWLAATELALALTVDDGTVDVAFAAPKVQIMDPTTASRNRKLTHAMKGQLNRSAVAGNDELTIITS